MELIVLGLRQEKNVQRRVKNLESVKTQDYRFHFVFHVRYFYFDYWQITIEYFISLQITHKLMEIMHSILWIFQTIDLWFEKNTVICLVSFTISSFKLSGTVAQKVRACMNTMLDLHYGLSRKVICDSSILSFSFVHSAEC